MFTGLRRVPEPVPLSRYSFSRIACEASRWRLRFLIDRRRRFMPGLNFQLRLRHSGRQIAFPVDDSCREAEL